MEGAYASTPVVIAQNMVVVFAETVYPKLEMIILPGDVSTAFLHAALPEEMRVVLIPPSPQRVAGKAWLPLRAIYGLRVSPGLFQEYLAAALEKNGCTRCQADRQLFFCRRRSILVSVHADDIIMAIPKKLRAQFCADLERDLIIRWSEPMGDEFVRYLGHEWRRVPGGFAVRNPAKFFDGLLTLYGSQECRPIKSPNVSADELRDDASPLLMVADISVFRSAVGKLLWLSHVRLDVSYLTKELARRVQKPTQLCQAVAKSLLRYLAGTRHAVYYLRLQPGRRDRNLEVWADASWGSDVGRRSTSGGILYCG